MQKVHRGFCASRPITADFRGKVGDYRAKIHQISSKIENSLCCTFLISERVLHVDHIFWLTYKE